MPRYTGPLLTRDTATALLAARERGEERWTGSLDLGRSQGDARLEADRWDWGGVAYPYAGKLKERTLYWWDGEDFEPVSRYRGSLIKLVPTEWGVPTFEIDGIKMLPTSKESPLDDAKRKVALVEPRGKTVLDTCGGLGYFAACCLDAGAARIVSFEKNADVLWLRTLNPGRPIRTASAPAAACSSPMPMCRRRSQGYRRHPSTRCCTTRRASASPASCTRRRSTTSSHASCAGAAPCSTTPAAPTS